MRCFLILICCIVLTAVAGGCSQLVGGYKTSIKVSNSSDLQLSDVELTSESGFFFRFGYVPPRLHKVYVAPIPGSPQSVFTLTWTEEASGLKHEKRLDVPSLVTRTHGKTLVFEISDNGDVSVFVDGKW